MMKIILHLFCLLSFFPFLLDIHNSSSCQIKENNKEGYWKFSLLVCAKLKYFLIVSQIHIKFREDKEVNCHVILIHASSVSKVPFIGLITKIVVKLMPSVSRETSLQKIKMMP